VNVILVDNVQVVAVCVIMTKPYFFVQWDSTSRCNLNCLHCYHTQEERQTRGVMTSEEAKLMLKDLSDTTRRWDFRGGIHFSGGEPLLRSDFFELTKYSTDLGLEMRMLSNGTLVTPNIARKLKDTGFEIVQVSIDGTKDVHNYLRNRHDAYDLAINGIKNLRAAGIQPTVATTLSKTNFQEIERIIQEAYRAGAVRIGFSQLVPEGTGKDLEMLSAEELYHTFFLLNQLRPKFKGQIEILHSESLWCLFEDNQEYAEKAKAENALGGGCGVGMFGISVLSDGIVYPCRRLPISIGHISDGIQKIFIESELLNKFRDLNNYKCKDCIKVTLCRGCRAVAYAVTGNPFAKDPQCFFHLMEQDDSITPIS